MQGLFYFILLDSSYRIHAREYGFLPKDTGIYGVKVVLTAGELPGQLEAVLEASEEERL